MDQLRQYQRLLQELAEMDKRGPKGSLSAALKQVEQFGRATSAGLFLETLPRILPLENSLRFNVAQLLQSQDDVAKFRPARAAELLKIHEQMTTMTSRHLALIVPDLDFIQKALGGIEKPWVALADSLHSIKGASCIAALGDAIRLSPFGLDSANIFRAMLGDWQNATIPWEEFSDWRFRNAFYFDKGFDPKITAFPESAYNELLLQTGALSSSFSRDVQTPRPTEEVQATDAVENRRIRAFKILARFENAIRTFIHQELSTQFRSDWERQRAPGAKVVEWQEKKEKSVAQRHQPQDLIFYADFSDYRQIILRKDNWNDAFSRFFGKNKRDIEVSFERLEAIRIEIMHARPLTLEDFMLLSVEASRILRAVGCDTDDL